MAVNFFLLGRGVTPFLLMPWAVKKTKMGMILVVLFTYVAGVKKTTVVLALMVLLNLVVWLVLFAEVVEKVKVGRWC